MMMVTGTQYLDSFLLPSLTPTSDTSSNSTSINATLAEVARQNNFPALSAAYDNGTFHIATTGVRKIGTDVYATDHDIWHWGSNTKAMTATVVGMLIQEGLLAWSSTLGDLLGQTGLSIRSVYASVTVQQLSSHTSGVSDRVLTTNTVRACYDLSAADGRVFMSNFTLSASPISTRGTYEYANMNYILLGLIIDTITGEPAEEVIRTRLWDPLGIATAGWGPNPESSLTSINNPYPHIANGSLGRRGLPTPLPETFPMVQRDNPPALHTAGAAHMSMADYDKWLRTHIDPTVQVMLNLSEATVRKLHEVAPGTGQNFYTYGGWARIDSQTGEGYSLMHDGSNTMNYATALVEVGEKRAAFVVTNVGGQALDGATWTEGTHLVRDNLLTGKFVM
jgi:D-alanyl-D-alanine carboxypeptidase